jgi:hypothetical protein
MIILPNFFSNADEGSQSATSSAWDKEMTSSEVSLGEIGGEKVDGGADLWSAAAGELQAKQQREQDRKAEVGHTVEYTDQDVQ